MQLAGGNHGILAHTPVDVDAEDLEVAAAVGLAPPAGRAAPAVEVGLQSAARPHCYMSDLVPDCSHFHAKLMAENARIGKERLPAAHGMQIGAADPDTSDAHHGLAQARRGRRRPVGMGQQAGFPQDDRIHRHVLLAVNTLAAAPRR